MDRGPITLPLIAFYGQEPDRMIERNKMYTLIARVFGSQGWRFQDPTANKPAGPAGFDGRAPNLRLIDQQRAAILNSSSAPLEYLAAIGGLESNKDKNGTGLVRLQAGLRYRDAMSGAGIGGLKSSSLEGGSGGGGGGRPVSEFKIDCMRTISSVRDRMPTGLYHLFERAIWLDEWVWERKARVKGKDGKVKVTVVTDRKTVLDLQRALDHTAVVFGYVTRDEFDLRWRPDHAKARRAKAGA